MSILEVTYLEVTDVYNHACVVEGKKKQANHILLTLIYCWAGQLYSTILQTWA